MVLTFLMSRSYSCKSTSELCGGFTNLQWRALCRQSGETDDVAEVYGDRVESLGLNRLAPFQLLGYRTTQKQNQTLRAEGLLHRLK